MKPSHHSTKTDFDVIVLGAGVVGVNTAYWNLRNGKSVCVIDRQPEAGLETSFANGGQVSVSHAEPWANPTAPFKVIKWLLDSDAPLLFRPTLDIHQWLWMAKFLVDCLPSRADRHTSEIVNMALESRRLIGEIRAKEGFHYDERAKGILHFYRDKREFDAAIPVAELMRKFGCAISVIDTGKAVEIEPALAERRAEIVGASFSADDESGDALKYTQALAGVCEKMGATFLYGTQVTALGADRGAKKEIGRDQRPGGLRKFARARHRGQPRLLVRAVPAALWRAAEHLSGQGLFGDDPDRDIQRRTGDEPYRRRVQARLFQSRRPAARRRHSGAVGLFTRSQYRAVRGDPAYMCATCFRARAISRASAIGPACARRRLRTSRISGVRAIAISGSIPATARSAGRSARAPDIAWRT